MTTPPSLDASLDSPTLHALLREWDGLRTAPATDDPAFVQSVKTLAKRVVAHRAQLFATNARLLADAPRDDDPATLEQTESNQLAIKACTNMLTEMTAALGRASIPTA
jgi:hypothetical protein